MINLENICGFLILIMIIQAIWLVLQWLQIRFMSTTEKYQGETIQNLKKTIKIKDDIIDLFKLAQELREHNEENKDTLISPAIDSEDN